MKKLVFIFLQRSLLVALLLVLSALPIAVAAQAGACSPALQKAVTSILTKTAKCLVEEQDLSDPAIYAKCGIEAVDQPAASSDLAAIRAASARSAASHRPSQDAGAEASAPDASAPKASDGGCH